VVFGAGRIWDDAKNIAVLCQAAQDLDVKIRVAGDDISPDGSTHDLKGVEFLGPLNRSQMTVEMGRAVVFASPALYEPFGLTILEAGLSACALVLADIPTLRELWGGAATFVDPRDVRSWHHTLSWLTRNPARAAEQGRRARSRALAYTSERMADAYCDAYGTLTSTKLMTEAAA
jgi:glycosyltransferase involved in cell wall biosynthesis